MTAPPGRLLPRIEGTADDELATELVGEVMRETSRALRGGPARIVMRGGTAAKIGHGLPRPSRDIDIDLIGNIDPWATLQRAAENAGLTALAQPDRRRTLKGELLLTDERAGTVRIQVDIRAIRDDGGANDARQGITTEHRAGVLMYRGPVLVAQKLEMLALPEPRLRAKDRYDLAWWLSERIEFVPPELRMRLDKQLREHPSLQHAWDDNHRRDPMLRTVDPDTVHAVLTNTLDHDPAALQTRWPDGQLTLEVDEGPSTTLSWNCGPGAEPEIPIGRFQNDQELERFMQSHGLWRPDDIPERLKELTLERQRAIEAARARGRS